MLRSAETSRGTGPRATVWGTRLGTRRIARDRPSRYGIEDIPCHRRAGACPPPCCGLPKPREGQALALRYGEGGWASEDREGQALALRYRRCSVYRRAGACPPPCCALPKPREGQALALRYGDGGWGIGGSRGTGPRATVWGRWLGHRRIARTGPRATVEGDAR